MKIKPFAEYDAATKCTSIFTATAYISKQIAVKWLRGDLMRFSVSKEDADDLFIYREVLKARCPTASFNSIWLINSHFPYIALAEGKVVCATRLALWLICGALKPIDYGVGGETEFLHIFKFAEKYNLPEFADFLSVQFAQFAPNYYGGQGRSHVGAVPIDNLAFALNELDRGSVISRFIVEQFIRCWILGCRYYTSDEFGFVLNEFPEVLRTICCRVQDVVDESEENAVAFFERVQVHVDEAPESVETNELEQPVHPLMVGEPVRPATEEKTYVANHRAKPTESPTLDTNTGGLRRTARRDGASSGVKNENKGDQSTEETAPEEVAVTDVPEEAMPAVETGVADDEPVEATELVDYDEEAVPKAEEVVGSIDGDGEPVPEAQHEEPVPGAEEGRYSWLKGAGNKPPTAVY